MRSTPAHLSGCLAICLLLAMPLLAQTVPQPAAAPIPDMVAYAASQFGPTFTLDPTIKPMFGDLDGDGNEDLILVGRSDAPLASKDQFDFKVEDPYDAYYGTGETRITSSFSLHFDGSARCILVVFGWRMPPHTKLKPKSKLASKYVLINTPFETVSIVNLRLKQKHVQAIEAVDRDTLHALIFWDGKRWLWRAQGMEGDETLMPRRN
jgi:hypothetical protein